VVAMLDSNDQPLLEDCGGGVVRVGQVALVGLRPLKALVVEPHSAMGSLGRIVVHDGKVPLAIGKVVSVVRRLKHETASLVNPAHSTQCNELSHFIIMPRTHHNDCCAAAGIAALGDHSEMLQHGEDELQHYTWPTTTDSLLSILPSPLVHTTPPMCGRHVLRRRDVVGNRKAGELLLANGALFQLSAGRGHDQGGVKEAKAIHPPHVFWDASTGTNAVWRALTKYWWETNSLGDYVALE
jgi:hypothetical protein